MKLAGSSLNLLVLYLLIGKGGADEASTRVVERCEELQKEMLLLSGRMSKVSQSVTRSIYRTEDDIRKELDRTVKDVKTMSQQLTGKGVKEWTCVTSIGNIQLGTTSWKSLHVCLHSLADKLSTTEARLSSLTGRLRTLALPCHMDIQCNDTHTEPAKEHTHNNKNNNNVDNTPWKNNNDNNAKNPIQNDKNNSLRKSANKPPVDKVRNKRNGPEIKQNNSTIKNANAPGCRQHHCEENDLTVDPNVKETISPYDQHYKLEPSSTKDNCKGKGCTKMMNRRQRTKQERYGCCSPVKALNEMEEIGKKGRTLANKMDALGNSMDNEIETCMKQVKQEIIKFALIKTTLSRCNN